MSDTSDLDEDIEKILNDLGGSYNKKTSPPASASASRQKNDLLNEDDKLGQPERETPISGQRRGSADNSFNPVGRNPSKTQTVSERPASPSFNRRLGVPETVRGGNALLANLFANDDDGLPSKPKPLESAKPFPPSSAPKLSTENTDRMKSTPAPTLTAKIDKGGDWLGLGPSSSPTPPFARRRPSLEAKNAGEDDDGEDDILRTLRFGGKSEQTRQKAEKPLKPVAKATEEDTILLEKLNKAKKLQQPRAELGGSFEDKLPQSLNLSRGPSLFEDKFGSQSSLTATTPPPKSIQQFPAFSANPVAPSSGSSQHTTGPPNDIEKSAFLQSLFGGSSATPIHDEPASDTQRAMQPEHEISSVTKKKVVKKQALTSRAKEIEGEGDGSETKTTTKIGKTTLQVASHLIDEDELKTMSSSLKTLYTNQLDMMEKTYSEQIKFLTQSQLRKEDMLKEEIKMIHKDYESRMERLKNELLELETSSRLAKRQQDENSTSGIVPVLQLLKDLNSKVDLITSQPQHPNINASSLVDNSEQIKSAVKDMDAMVDAKLTTFQKSLAKVMGEKLETYAKNSLQFENVRPELKEISEQIGKSEKKRKHEVAKFGNAVVEGTATTLSSAVLKLSEVQKKVGESIARKMLTSISQTTEEAIRNANAKSRDKNSNQMKEFREDLRRFSVDLQDSLLKFQASSDGDQKQIRQSLQDLNSWLQAHFTRNSLAIGSQANLQNSSLQTELEMQLLKEERKSMSESLAEINVERRKLIEEKVEIEQDKRDLERERNRVLELQIDLKSKLADLDEMQKAVEATRKENYRLGAQIVRQQNEIESDRLLHKESLRSIEDNLRLQQETVFREKLDIVRDKDFFEQLRRQLLCPGCLKSLVQTSQPNLPMTQRSIGDGLENPPGPLQPNLFQTSPIQFNDVHLSKEIKFLDDLYLGGFKS